MAKQTAKQQSEHSLRRATQTKSSPPSGSVRGSAQPTSERDENYDLISVLYHALQGAETIGRYLDDAQEARDEALGSFLDETRDEYNNRADTARELLARRLGAARSEDLEEADEEDEEEDEDD